MSDLEPPFFVLCPFGDEEGSPTPARILAARDESKHGVHVKRGDEVIWLELDDDQLQGLQALVDGFTSREILPPYTLHLHHHNRCFHHDGGVFVGPRKA